MANKMIKQGLLIALTAIVFACTKSPVINEDEEEWLKNHPNLSIGISTNQPPYEFINENGEINGMFIDFLTIIEDRLDYKFKKIFQPDWIRLLSDTKEGKIDIVLEIQETNERKEFLNFTPFLLSHKHVIIVKNIRNDIASISDLKDKKIAVVNTYAVQEYLLKNYPGYSVIPFFDNVSGLRAVSTEQADAFISQQAVATYFIQNEGISNLKIAGEIDYPNELAIASRKELDTLHIILSKAVNAITHSEKKTIYNRWLYYKVKPFYAETKFWIAFLSVIFVTFTLGLLFNLELRKRVRQKTNELKVAKEKVEENYTLLRIAGEKAKLGWWHVHLKEFRSYWSDIVATIHEMPPGYSPLVEDGINFYAPEWREKIKKVFTDCAQYGIPYDEEMEIITSTGKRVWVRTIGEAVRNEKGEIFKVEGAFQDITDRKRAEAVLDDLNQRSRLATEASGVGIWEWSLNTNRVRWDKQMFRMYGMIETEDGFVDYNDISACVLKEELPEQESILQETIKQRGKSVREFHIRRQNDGHVRFIQANDTVLINEKGNIQWLLGTNIDITDRKQAQDKVIESQAELKKALEISNQSRQTLLSVLEDQQLVEETLRAHSLRLQNLIQIDKSILLALESPEEVVKTAIKQMRELLHCQRVSVGIFDLEKKEVLIYAADSESETIVQVGKILAEEMYGNIDILFQNKLEIVEDMSKVAFPSAINKMLQAEGIQSSINIALISSLKMYGALNIGWKMSKTITQDEIDISKEVGSQITIAIEKAALLKETIRYSVELEQRVIERTAQLEASNKELESFSYSVSHDLRAPLRHINGYVDLLNSRYKDELPEKARHYLETISGASGQMGVLIDELLKYSRTGQKEVIKSEIDINTLLKDVLNEMTPVTKGRKITWNIQDLPNVLGDYYLLKLVWTNLLDNAIKYTRNQQIAKIGISYKKEAKDFVFCISDNGVGFDMKYAHKLFGVFQRLHSQTEFEGTGIGLAHVQRIIHKHLGRVWAEAEPGKGAKFYFSLPIKLEEKR